MFNTKKRFFKKKIKAVTRQIWEYEFKVEKSSQVREGIRQDRDKLLDAHHKVVHALKTDEKNEKLIEESNQINDTIQRYEKQMKMIDDQINGGVPTEENPAGQGLIEIINSLAELRRMYKDYIKKL